MRIPNKTGNLYWSLRAFILFLYSTSMDETCGWDITNSLRLNPDPLVRSKSDHRCAAQCLALTPPIAIRL